MVAPDRKASAIAIMFTGLTVATILGVPFGIWPGQALGWRATFWSVTAIGLLAHGGDHGLRAQGRSRARSQRLAQRCPRTGTSAGSARVLGFGGMFAVFSYIAPLLTEVTGFSEAAVSPILLVFGGGLIGGNLIGGRLADWRLAPAMLSALLALAVTLGS